jgi:hypothetical protein
MATFFRNSLISGIGTVEKQFVSIATNSRATLIGLSLTNTTSDIVLASIKVQNNPVTTTYTASGSSGTTLVVASTTSIVPGMTVTTTGFAAVTTVVSITNSTTVVLSAGPTGTPVNSQSVTFNSVSAYYVRNVVVPPNQSLRVINGGEKLVLAGDMVLYVQSSTDTSLDLIASYVEII